MDGRHIDLDSGRAGRAGRAPGKHSLPVTVLRSSPRCSPTMLSPLESTRMTVHSIHGSVSDHPLPGQYTRTGGLAEDQQTLCSGVRLCVSGINT